MLAYMPINNPTQLVDEFKKSGEFDRLRRELLSQFQQGDGFSTFKSKVEDIARIRLESDQKLRFLPQEAVHKELMQEMDRFPIVERAAAEVQMLSDPSFIANIRKSVKDILLESKGQRPRTLDDNSVLPIKPEMARPSDTPSHIPQAVISTPSTGTTSTPKSSESNVTLPTPPPITTFETPPTQTQERILENEKTGILNTVSQDFSPPTTMTAGSGPFVNIKIPQPSGETKAS